MEGPAAFAAFASRPAFFCARAFAFARSAACASFSFSAIVPRINGLKYVLSRLDRHADLVAVGQRFDAHARGLLRLRLDVVVDHAGGVVIEADVGAVGPALVAHGAHDDRLHHVALLDRAVGQSVAHAAHDDVAERSVLAVAAAHDVETLQLARAGVV